MTANHELVIDISGTLCKLVSPDRAEFMDLIGLEMSPGLLLTKLQKRGVNLMPTAKDLASVADIIPKVDPQHTTLTQSLINKIKVLLSLSSFTVVSHY